MLRGKCVHRIPSTNKDLIRVIYIVQRLNSLKHIWTLFKVNNALKCVMCHMLPYKETSN